MTLTQVDKFMPEGIRAVSGLLNMLFEAAAACKVSARLSASRQSIGITLDGLKYWLGVGFRDPEILYFGTRCRIDPEAGAKLGIGEVTEESWVPGRYRWWHSTALDSEEVHFFSRTKVGQMEFLESFLKDGLAKARKIEISGEPPPSQESEET
jgi:hypothetical protein